MQEERCDGTEWQSQSGGLLLVRREKAAGLRGKGGFLPEMPRRDERRAACGCSSLCPPPGLRAAVDFVTSSGPGFQLYRVYMLSGVLKVLL